MINLSERVADSYRQGKTPKANPGNKVTSKRRKLYSIIKDRTGGDPQAEMDYAVKIIQKERPKIENYVLSKNEVPADDIQDLIMQAYQLRCDEIDSHSKMLSVSEGEAGIFLEEDEAESETANNPAADSFIGELFAPIGIAAKHIQGDDSDSFVDSGLVSGIINTIGSKVDKGTLRRAAENKKAGVLGFLSGGKNQYELLRTYLQDPANAAEKQAVLKGTITDITQLKGYGGAAGQAGGNRNMGAGLNVAGVDVLKAIEDQKKKDAIKKALPFVIIGLIVIILVTILIVKKNAKSN
jgi:hypothetical protein